MPNWPDDYVKYVLKDLEKYNGKLTPIKASLFERLFKKKLAPTKLHPNPADEFSWESTGPNFQIIGDYAEQLRTNMALQLPLFEEPLIVEKTRPDGYMLVNGHHRWFASLRVRVPKVPVRIANLTHAEDIVAAINRSTNTMSVAFDLDEVLLVGENGFSAEPLTKRIGRKVIPERLRLGAVKAITELQSKGFDVWVYTASYQSEKYLNAMFNLYGVKVDGIINGIKRKKDKKAEEMITKSLEKYTHRLHIDNNSLVCTYVKDSDFDQFDLEGDADNWADSIVSTLEKIKYDN